MSDRQILPSPGDIIGRGIAEVTSRRPQTLPKFNAEGRWLHPFIGWRGQIARNTQRVAEEMRAARLPMSSGDALVDLAESEFGVSFPERTGTAVGTVHMLRTGAMPRGEIRAGHPFYRAGNPSASPIPIESADYVATASVRVAAGQPTVVVPIRATRQGAHANITASVEAFDSSIVSAEPLFDAAFTTVYSEAAGGADSLLDASVRRAAGEMSIGQWGAVNEALAAAALMTPGVRRVAYFDGPNGVAHVPIADASWASSEALRSRVNQTIEDGGWRGFGCKVQIGTVSNQFALVDASIVLRNETYLTDTSAIDTAVIRAVQSYFDDRREWYLWTLDSLRSVISSAHHRILECSEVFVRNLSGMAITEPDPVAVYQLETPWTTHIYVTNSSLQTTYLPPYTNG